MELDGHRYIVSDGVYAHSHTGKIVEDRSSSTASGSGGDSSGYGLRDFGKDVGGFFVGLWEGFSETVTGIYQSGCLSAASPVLAMVGPGINACAETVSNTVSYAVTDPKGFGLALWHGTTDPIVDDWNSGNYGEAIGRGVFAFAELALGTKGATKLGSLAKSNLRGMGNILRSERGSISFGGAGGGSVLSAIGQQNVRVLRNWAKSKGWVRQPGTGPEVWGVREADGSFSWRLKIKPQPSMRPGLEAGSQQPRFDARLGPGQYINPFTGEIGGRSVGTHLPLERKWW